MQLFTKDEAQEVISTLQAVPKFNVLLTDLEHGLSSGQEPCEEGKMYQQTRNDYHTPQGILVGDYAELGDAPHPYMSRMLAREMAKLIAYLKANGDYQIMITQDLGNCLFAAVLRGTSVKKEFASMHLRRLIVKMVGAFPDFFFN
ncbi:MAG: hypothetical protein MJE68_33250, partial [Proteobacteria bacterium]|nr:hypothetical protein [Pseudomonadota bacterium]